jgi:hypothetical protein
MSRFDSPVVAYGKVVFIPVHKPIPPLPDMNLIFFHDEDQKPLLSYRALCIDLEIDACGSSIEDSWKNLKTVLGIYIDTEVETAGSIKDAAKNIINIVFGDSEQKKAYFDIYLKTKYEETLRKIEEDQIIDPISEEKVRLEELQAQNESIRSIVNKTNTYPRAA